VYRVCEIVFDKALLKIFRVVYLKHWCRPNVRLFCNVSGVAVLAVNCMGM
jgi:hypothetical protein